MKRRVKKLIMLSLSTLMAASSLATSTYAWFKLNSTAMVENFDFEVVSGLGFEVSIDGVHYYGDLNLDQMRKAIVASYDSSMYQIRGYDEEGKDKPDVLYKYSGGKFKALSESDAELEIQSVLKKIRLLPATTYNGRDFKDLYNGTYTTTSGRYLEFGVYFKATSDNPNDKLKYDIYMNGYDGLEDRGDQMVDTIFTSKITHVDLSAGMTSILNNNGTKSYNNLSSGESIDVYSSNAARISATESVFKKDLVRYNSTTDTTYDPAKSYYTYDSQTRDYVKFEGQAFDDDVIYYERELYDAYVVNDESTYPTLIYELNDTENPYTDLGSYATNYTGKYTVDALEALIARTKNTDPSDDAVADKNAAIEELNNAINEDKDLALYSSYTNAMYTYYNNLKTEGNLEGKALEKNDIPQNIIRTLPTRKSSDIKKASSPGEANDSTYYPITTVESGADAKLITFRVWLEGWDADCFDGLSNSIDVRLAFSSKRVY